MDYIEFPIEVFQAEVYVIDFSSASEVRLSGQICAILGDLTGDWVA